MPPILELRGVTKSYGSYKVVDAFDFIVEQGECDAFWDQMELVRLHQ